MLKLSDRNWRLFNAFGKKGLFKIHTTNSGIDKNKLLDDKDKTIPYITRSGDSNGVTDFISRSNLNNGYDPANVITIGLDTQTAFYQPYKFVTGQNIHIITGEQLNPLIIHFLLPLLRQQMVAKFNWGGNGATLSRMNRLRLMLPVDDAGHPDYEFMEQYERELIRRKKAKYQNYCVKILSTLGPINNVESLSQKNWGTFRIVQLFDSITRPPARAKGKYEIGEIPFIASGASLNGAVKFCKPHNGETLDPSNCITISPVDGSAFYQATDFLGRGGGGSSIIMLRSSHLNQYIGLFMAKCINNTTSKYQYGHMATSDGIKRDRVLLPVDGQGQPDYDYMEQYVKNKMIKKYQRYLDYIKLKS